MPWAQVVAWFVGWIPATAAALEWVPGLNADVALIYVVLLLLAPVAWFVRRRSRIVDSPDSAADSTAGARENGCVGAWVLSILCGGVSLTMSVWIGSRFDDLPPAYHDEYAYLFQAKTFLLGRVWVPAPGGIGEDGEGVFEQMHVLNVHGRLAGRYFPAAAAWMAPFVAVGRPYWGHWLAGAVSASLAFWIGRELAGNGVGLLAGLTTALSPGVGLFSNLLLAHHPTLLGLTIFLLGMLRLMRTGRRLDALVAGMGLAFAMLCRPMTAAGVALPFGLWTLWWLVRGRKANGGERRASIQEVRKLNGRRKPLAARSEFLANSATPSRPSFRRRLGTAAVLGAPLAAGLVGMFFYDRAVTGDGWTTPYQLYTDVYTPRHAYGFDNVVRGEQALGPRVRAHYDEWALNLTPRLAAENAAARCVWSLAWTLDVVPLVIAIVVFVVSTPLRIAERIRVVADAASVGEDAGGILHVAAHTDLQVHMRSRWWLVFASIVSLHAVHAPYWYVGIMNWHYVFESAPLLALVFAAATCESARFWKRTERPLMPVWWAAVVLTALLSNYGDFAPFGPSRMSAAVADVRFSREKHARFRRTIELGVTRRPALVLIKPDPADRHIDYIVNDPPLEGEILYARMPDNGDTLKSLQDRFTGRTLYQYDAATGVLTPISHQP